MKKTIPILLRAIKSKSYKMAEMTVAQLWFVITALMSFFIGAMTISTPIVIFYRSRIQRDDHIDNSLTTLKANQEELELIQVKDTKDLKASILTSEEKSTEMMSSIHRRMDQQVTAINTIAVNVGKIETAYTLTADVIARLDNRLQEIEKFIREKK